MAALQRNRVTHMAQDWYYKLLGEETGPVTFRALRELAADGHLAANDEVRTSHTSWKPAAEVSELFTAGEVEEPELATDYDLDMLLSPSSAPVKVSDKRRGMNAAKAAASAPARHWYYKLLGQEIGPATSDEVLEQIRCGSLHYDDLVKDGPKGSWIPLEKAKPFASAAASMKPQAEWYCRVLGQELGPMTFDELEEMVTAGSLHADDEVRHGDDDWMRADRTRGLKFSKTATLNMVAHDRSATYVPFGDDAKRKEWYYEILGQEMGPISFTEMLKAVGSGTLTFEDKARKGKAGAWSLVMDVPGLVSTEAKANYLAAKLEASRPRPVPVVPTPVAPAAEAAAIESPTRSVVPSVAPARSVVPASPSASMGANSVGMGGSSTRPSYGSDMGGGMGGMSASRTMPPPPPAFKAPKKSSGPAFDFGAIFDSLKEMVSPKAIAAVGAILFAGLLIVWSQFGLSFGVVGIAEYQQVKDIMVKLDAAATSKDAQAMPGFAKQYESKLKSLQKAIESKSPGSDKPLLQMMLFVVRDRIPAVMKDDNESAAQYKVLKEVMNEAAVMAGEK